MKNPIDDKIKELFRQTEPKKLNPSEIDRQYHRIIGRIEQKEKKPNPISKPLSLGVLIAAGLSLLIWGVSFLNPNTTGEVEELYGYLNEYAEYQDTGESYTQTYQDWLEFSELGD